MSNLANERLTLLDTYIKEYWQKKDKRLARILKIMDNVEHWVYDDEEDFSTMSSKLGVFISNCTGAEIEKIIDHLIMVMAYISSSKALRFLNWLEEFHPEVFEKYLQRLPLHSRPKTARLMSTRIRVLNGLNVMGKIFSQERSQRINNWLRTQLSQEAT